MAKKKAAEKGEPNVVANCDNINAVTLKSQIAISRWGGTRKLPLIEEELTAAREITLTGKRPKW